MKTIGYTVGFGFGGYGGGAMGFLRAEAHLLGTRARFHSVGSFDKSERACANYRYLTGTEQTCVDARELTPGVLRAIFGETAPDVFFASPPCQGASALLSDAKAKTPHYQALNELAVVWTRLMLETWTPGPRIALFENVPRVTARAPEVVREVRNLFKAHGYVVHDGPHELGEYAPGGRYDAGVLGGLAQHRERWLLVARDPRRCSPLLYRPPIRRVRAVGEVLGSLPLPGDPDGGSMHALPKLSPMNWLRLAMIPAGGDWRDIPGVLAEGQQRREVFRRHHLSAWDAPAPTVGGPGSNGPQAVADPRVRCAPRAGAYGVIAWDAPAPTVTASFQIDNGAASVADPRVEAFRDGYGVIPWDSPSGTITADARPSKGDFAVADPRERISGPWLTLDEASKLLFGPGPWAIVDRASDGSPVAVIHDLRKPSPIPILIVAEDGTWHRPLTVLELAVLQGLPPVHNGAPLRLSGPATADREGIGSMVPPPAAMGIAEQMLVSLLQHDLGAFALSGVGGVWVDPMEAALQ